MTEANNPRSKGGLFLLGSLLMHGLLLGILALSGLLEFQRSVDRQALDDKAREAMKRKEALEARERARRAERRMPREHADIMRRAAEAPKRLAAKKRLSRIRRNLEELERLKAQREAEIRRRDVREMEADLVDRIVSRARILEQETRHSYGGEERLELRELARKAREQAERFAAHANPQAETADSPAEAAKARQEFLAAAEQAHQRARGNAMATHFYKAGSESLGLPRDRAHLKIADELHQLARRLADPKGLDPEALNDLSASTDARVPAPADAATDKVAYLYKRARRLETEFDRQYRETRALDQALADLRSFPEALASQPALSSPDRPDLTADLGANPETVGEVGELRSHLDAFGEQLAAIDERTGSLLGQIAGANQGTQATELSSQIGRALALAATEGAGRGSPDLSGALRALAGSPGAGQAADAEFHLKGEGGQFMRKVDRNRSVRLPSDQIQAQAIPARRFSPDANRRGWLYVDTWYVIGPWENDGRIDYGRQRPPEFGIDYDAVYADGKRVPSCAGNISRATTSGSCRPGRFRTGPGTSTPNSNSTRARISMSRSRPTMP